MNQKLFWPSVNGLRLLSNLERKAPTLVVGHIPLFLARSQALHVASWLRQLAHQAHSRKRLALPINYILAAFSINFSSSGVRPGANSSGRSEAGLIGAPSGGSFVVS